MRQDDGMLMVNLFTDYPPVLWKPGWSFLSGPGDSVRFITGSVPGALTLPGADWTLQLLPATATCSAQLFSNGFSISPRGKSGKKRIDALLLEPGVWTGSRRGLPDPSLIAPDAAPGEPGITWVEAGHHTTLLLCQEERFALVTGDLSKEQALRKAEDALDEEFEQLTAHETERRIPVGRLFSVNPRHNPPVALATESLNSRLRVRTASIHGLWSAAEGFEEETFSLNELFALIHAWTLLDPATALELTRTALSLQQSTGGFPAWIDKQGVTATVAPWPLMAQTFEHAWESGETDPLVLKQALPSLRKYIQWALRRFDPHRDGIPAWQSEQEIFVPESFERDKATPELTVMLLGEVESLLRLCEKNHDSATAIESLSEQREQLARTLTSIFWNPDKKSFSNVWKDGHFIDQPSFGSFLPLLWKNLDSGYKMPLLEEFEETHGFPGRDEPLSWKQEQIDDTAHLPAIHQFMAFEALRRSDANRALLLLFVRRAREGFAAWFERESIEAARLVSHGETSGKPAFNLGPVTASLILTTQFEFQREAEKNAPIVKQILRGFHRLRFDSADLRIIAIAGLAILLVHLLYTLPRIQDTDARMAEAALNYRQGRLRETMAICRRHPDHVLSRFLQANLLLLTGNPQDAEELYHQALRQETGSPSALFGYALALQMNGKYPDAIRRYNDFIDLYEAELDVPDQMDLIDLAYEFLRLAEEKFNKPPGWKRAYTLPVMNDLGL